MSNVCVGILIGWFAFVVLIYLWLIIDTMYYSHNMKNKLRKFKNVITEE